MFTSFFYLLRARGLKVSLNEWMSLIEALDKGLHHSSFTGFYYLCRAILVKKRGGFLINSTVPFWNISRIWSVPPMSCPRSFWIG
mgnify:CR=1 FL=1